MTTLHCHALLGQSHMIASMLRGIKVMVDDGRWMSAMMEGGDVKSACLGTLHKAH